MNEDENDYNTIFKLPIYYNKDKQYIDNSIQIDLELNDPSNNYYNNLFSLHNPFHEETIQQWHQYYTHDKKFLKDTQKLIKTFNIQNDFNFDSIIEIKNNQLDDDYFIDKYQYVSWDRLRILNNYSIFLHVISVYNITSPVLSLIMPIFFLIFPFFILKLQGKPISIAHYIEIIKLAFSNHQLGQIFNINSASWDKRVYILISMLFYIFQIYQNVRSCIEFYNNITIMHEQLFTVKNYLIHTINKMDNFKELCRSFKSYKLFINDMSIYKKQLEILLHEINEISEYKFSIQKCKEIGTLMKCFYQLNMNSNYINALSYSYGFNSYLNNLQSITHLIKLNKLSFCKFTTKSTEFNNAFYPNVNKPITNSYDLKKHIIITGPNAAGKTTLLKTTLFNIILSQQIGCGFYKKAKINPYHYLHCYINIPDTSGRDSLFQAEARRCKQIIDSVKKYSNKRHFCIFDELFSGTNPHEAISSAIAFLKYLNYSSNIDYIITTHFLNICYKLELDKTIHNLHMDVLVKENNFEYTYKLKSGISEIKGGVKVLNDLNFPNDIIDNTKKYIKEIYTLN